MKRINLKNSILNYAFEGKLVPQDINNDSVNILIEGIKREKEQLIKDGKIKRNKNESIIYKKNNHFYEKRGEKGEPVCIDKEINLYFHNLPEGWRICRLNNVCEIYTGNSINKTEKKSKFMNLDKGYNYIATKDVSFNHQIDYENGVKIPKHLDKFKIAKTGSILLCIEGGSAGRKIALTNQDVCFGNKLCCFNSFGINKKFLYYYLQSPQFKQIFKSKKNGIIGGVGIGKIRNLLIPVPPLEEQKRMILKIDELIPYIERCNQKNKYLNKLNEVFPINLKNSILNYALEGKLVPQDINNDSVNVLIKNIKRGKEQLIKDGKIKRNKNESIIYKENNHFYEKRGEKGEPICIDDELPFSIPDNWAWIRFENIVNFSIGKTPTRKSYEYWNSGEIPWVSIADLKHQKTINKTKEKINKYALDNVFKNRIIPKDTLLMSFKLTIGKVSILGMDAVHNEAIISVKPFFDKDNILRNYLFYILPLISQGGKTKSAIKGKTLNKNSLSNLYIPLPPLEEQKRIVDKIKILYEKIELLKNSNNK